MGWGRGWGGVEDGVVGGSGWGGMTTCMYINGDVAVIGSGCGDVAGIGSGCRTLCQIGHGSEQWVVSSEQ